MKKVRLGIILGINVLFGLIMTPVVIAAAPMWLLSYLVLERVAPTVKETMRNVFWPHFTKATLIFHLFPKWHIAYGGGVRDNAGLWYDDTSPQCLVCGRDL